MDTANKMKSPLNEDLRDHRNGGVVGEVSGAVKETFEDLDALLADSGIKGRAQNGFASVKEGLETARDAVVDVSRKLNWKAVFGIAAGVAVVASMIIVTRRRRRGNLIERGLHEGARYAMLVPEGWHKAQNQARNLAQESARESVRLWKKVPRIHVELK